MAYKSSKGYSQPLNQVVPRIDIRVLLLSFVASIRSLYCRDVAAEVWIAEVCHAIPGRVEISPSRWFHNPVLCTLNRIVTPPRQQIASINDHSSRNWRRIHECSFGTLDLQTAPVILKQQRNTPIIGMLTRPNLQLILLKNLLRHTRVMQQPQSVVAHIGIAVEVALWQAHAYRDCSHDLNMQLLTLVMEARHSLLEPHGLLIANGPVVGETLLALSANLEGLFQIGSLGLQLGDIFLGDELGDLLAAVGDVATVCARGSPTQLLLLLLWALEELGGCGEDVVDDGQRDAVRGEVDKARGLEAVEDGLGGGLTLGGRPVEKEGEVYELERC